MSGEEAEETGPPGGGDLERRIEDQREEYTNLVEDVRERVIQVKREADAKAPSDHDHPELTAELEETERRLEELEATVEAVESSTEEVRSDLQSGFENYEDVLRYLTDLAEETGEHLDTLARAVVTLRETARNVAAAETAREEADRLKLTANRKGIGTADCEDCGGTVRVGLLSRPECPHCSTPFVDVESKNGLFGSPTLVSGTQPALEGEVDVGSEDLSGMVDDESAPPVDLTPEEDPDPEENQAPEEKS